MYAAEVSRDNDCFDSVAVPNGSELPSICVFRSSAAGRECGVVSRILNHVLNFFLVESAQPLHQKKNGEKERRKKKKRVRTNLSLTYSLCCRSGVVDVSVDSCRFAHSSVCWINPGLAVPTASTRIMLS